MRKSPRDRRLSADLRSVETLSAESSIFSFHAKGNLPQRYTLVFDGMGISRDSAGKIVPTSHHEVLVELGAAYPRMVPNLAWQTPVFHPNISNNGVVCLGGYGTHWVPSLTLAEMCTMLWDMIRYKNFDIASPYNRQAALWAQSQTHFNFPVDARPIRNLVADPGAAKPRATADKTIQSNATHWTKKIPFLNGMGNRTGNPSSQNGTPVGPSASSAESVSAESASVVNADLAEQTSMDISSTEDSETDSDSINCIDPSEIEVIVPGIQIISSNVDEASSNSSEATRISSSDVVQPEPEAPDTGIIFLD